MGDFEETFGAGADASDIIDGYAKQRRREDRQEGWRLAKLLGLPFRSKEKSEQQPVDPDEEARRLGLPTQAQIDRTVALAKAAEKMMEARIREAEAKKS